MKQAWKFLIVGAILVAIVSPPQPIHAQSLPPDVLVEGGVPPVSMETDPTNAATDAMLLSTAGLPPLKALLVLGPLDTAEFNTQKAIMDATADKLTNIYKIQVVKSYAPNNNWATILREAATSQFFIYRGHGIGNWGGIPTAVGGMKLQDGSQFKYVSPDDIRNEFRLAPNGLVFLFACYAAGGSGGETNTSLNTAVDRVNQYSNPFIDAGAAGYYSSWRATAFEDLIGLILQGKTLEEAYRQYSDFNNGGYAYNTTNSNHTSLLLWVDADNYPPLYYDYSFTGKATSTALTLFPPTMVVSSPGLTLLADPSTPIHTYTVHIDSNSSQTFSWTATLANKSASGSWVSLTPASGSSGQTVKVTLDPPASLGTYTATLQIAASNPSYTVGNGNQSLPIKIVVVQQVHSSFMPMISR